MASNPPKFDVTTIGEMMLRYSPPPGDRLEAMHQLNVYPAGAESNVVSLLARLGRRTRWVSALPENPLGRLAASALRTAGVDLGGVVWGSGRMGTYYIEFAPPPRGIQATYDRAGSCAAHLTPQQIDWDALLDTRLLHLTGITPALSVSCRSVVTEAIQRANAASVPVSFDVNYRQKLWTEAEAEATLLPLIQNVTLLFCGQADAKRLFGCSGSMQEIAQTLLERSHAQHVIVTFGEQGALLWDGSEWHHEPARETQIVDRLGAGDALAAGVIHGWLYGNFSAGARYGVTCAALALSQLGDMVVTTPDELERLVGQSATLTR
jgi:2-dehydro-3-deoxygluconokinase